MKILLIAVFLFSMFSYAQEETDEENSYITCYDDVSVLSLKDELSKVQRRNFYVNCIEIGTAQIQFIGFIDLFYFIFLRDYRIKCKIGNLERGKNCIKREHLD